MLMLIVGLFTASFNKGIHLNMHEVIPKPIDDHNKAIAVALSELKYGNLGYLGIEAIREKLFEHGLTKKPEFIVSLNAKLQKQGGPSNTLRSHIEVEEVKFPEILRNARLIDLAISKADTVDVPNVKKLAIEKKTAFLYGVCRFGNG
ncbi:hypothetical protein OBA45_01185 [bacterium]|nr:hypothetical protein [bacterium]